MLSRAAEEQAAPPVWAGHTCRPRPPGTWERETFTVAQPLGRCGQRPRAGPKHTVLFTGRGRVPPTSAPHSLDSWNIFHPVGGGCHACSYVCMRSSLSQKKKDE